MAVSQVEAAQDEKSECNCRLHDFYLCDDYAPSKVEKK